MTRVLDMTRGNPLGLIVKFSLPLVLINVLQMMYTIVDSAIVGQMLGIDAFAAISAIGNYNWMVLSMVIGVSQGFGIVFAQRFGAKDRGGLRKVFSTGIVLSLVVGALVGAAVILWSRDLLILMQTPDELLDDATLFVTILLGGMPITFFYNVMGAALRAMGDSKTPMWAMIFSIILNVILEVLFVMWFGIGGAATATLIAQAFACVYCVVAVRHVEDARFRLSDVNGESAKILLKMGLPLGLRNGVIEIGGLLIQFFVNGYGVEFVAGVGAAKRLYSLLMIAGNAAEAGVATFVAQNFGAQQMKRVRDGMKTGIKLMMASSVVMAVIAIVFGRLLLSMFISGTPDEVARVLTLGMEQLYMIAVGLPLLYLVDIVRASLQGVNRTLMPVLEGFGELGGTILGLALSSVALGKWGVYATPAVGWAIASIMLLVAFIKFWNDTKNAKDKPMQIEVER